MKEAERIQRLYSLADNWTRTQWEYINQKGYDFSNDNQLTAEELADLRSQGMPDFIINRITPVVEMLNFYATANNPRWQGIAVEGSDSNVAAVFSDMGDYIWSLSDGSTLYANTIHNCITKSLGYMMVNIDPNMDNGNGEVTLEAPEPFEVFPDPKSRHMLFKDASFIIIRKVLPKTHLISKFPEFKTKISRSAVQTDSQRSFSERELYSDQMSSFLFNDAEASDAINADKGETDEVVEYFECFEKLKKPYVNVELHVKLKEEELAQLKKAVDVELKMAEAEADVRRKEQEMSLMQAVESGEMIPERAMLEMQKFDTETAEQLSIMADQMKEELRRAMFQTEIAVLSKKDYDELPKEDADRVIAAIPFFKNRMQLTQVVGDIVLAQQEYPERIQDYPIVPFHWKWTGTPYPISAVAPLIGKQREINKTHQILVHNASLGSSLRWIYESGSIDTDYWEKYSSSPGALLEVNSGHEAPKEILPMQLSNAFFTLVQEGKQDIEYLAGIYSSMQGDTSSQHDTYRGMLAIDEYGTRRVKQWMKNSIEPALRLLGEVVMQYSQSLYTEGKVFRIVQPTALAESKQVEINIPIYNDLGEAIGKFNDYETARFDVRVIAGSTMPINRWAYLEQLKELLNVGVIDDIALLAETDIKNKDQIMKRKSLYAQLSGENEQLKEAVADRDGTIETLERQLVQAGIRHKVDVGAIEVNKAVEASKSEVDKETTQTVGEQKLLRSMAKAKAAMAEKAAKDKSGK